MEQLRSQASPWASPGWMNAYKWLFSITNIFNHFFGILINLTRAPAKCDATKWDLRLSNECRCRMQLIIPTLQVNDIFLHICSHCSSGKLHFPTIESTPPNISVNPRSLSTCWFFLARDPFQIGICNTHSRRAFPRIVFNFVRQLGNMLVTFNFTLIQD